MVPARHSTMTWGFWLLVAVAVACDGTAFHVDHDGEGGSAATAGSTPVAGKQQGGSASGGGVGGSGARPGGGGAPPANGGAGTQAGEAGTTGGEAGSASEPEPQPISLEGLVYWFKADAGITEMSGGISKWADQSGNGQHAEQQLSTQRPKLTQTELLPLPLVDLDGQTFLELPPIDAPIDGGLTFFAIAGRSEAESDCAAIVELSNGREIDDVFFGHGGLSMHFEVAAIWHDSVGPVFDPGTVRQVTMKHVYDGADAHVEMSANGAYVDTSEGDLPLAERKLRSQNFIGLTQYDNCTKFIGGIGEIILYSRVLDREEQQAVESYLLDKWQLPDEAP